MALPIKRSAVFERNDIAIPRISKDLQTSLENTQSCPCNIRARGLTTIPASCKGSVIGEQWVGNRCSLIDRSQSHSLLCNLHRKFQSICPEFPKLRSGKVREVFDLGETLLLRRHGSISRPLT